MPNQSNACRDLPCYYLVVFLDILGQKNDLCRIKNRPKTPQELDDHIRTVNAAARKVELVRNEFIEGFAKEKSKPRYADKIPSEYREAYIKALNHDVYAYGFSDSTIIVVPFAKREERDEKGLCKELNGVLAAFMTVGGQNISWLAHQIPLRGGMEVGLGLQLFEKEIYGTVLERAYSIESNLAEYPRIVLGDELIEYLDTIESSKYETPFGEWAATMARECKDMIVIDTDGRPVLDFMGKKFSEPLRSRLGQKLVEDAYSFVQSQCIKFKDNNKLFSRYYRLLKYIEDRKSLWTTPDHSS